MILSFFNAVFEVLACIFRAIGACAILLALSGFLCYVALDMCDGLSMILGLMAAGMTAIMATAAVYMELEQAVEEARAFRAWRISVKN